MGDLWSGSLVRRFGAVRVSQAALLACAAGMLVLLSGSRWLLLPSALLIGFGYGPITPASSHILMRTTPAHLMSLTFSIKQTGVPLGAMLAGLVLPPMVLAFGWRGGALGVALACVGVAILAEPTRRQLDTDAEPALALSLQHVGAPIRLVWSMPSLRLLGDQLVLLFGHPGQPDDLPAAVPDQPHAAVADRRGRDVFGGAGRRRGGAHPWGYLADRRVRAAGDAGRAGVDRRAAPASWPR